MALNIKLSNFQIQFCFHEMICYEMDIIYSKSLAIPIIYNSKKEYAIHFIIFRIFLFYVAKKE